ncbi:hypothetical protein KCP77_13325 [Salmonella enterica subsp. enterica]|nr:hypothetical protein KCP77_13325 [Salmonella enterica subsp. enterica]
MLDLICPQEKPCDSAPSTVRIVKRNADKNAVRSDAVTRVAGLPRRPGQR